MYEIVVLAIIVFLVLGWGFDLTHTQGPPGLSSLLVCLWALPVAVLIHTISSFIGEVTWRQYWGDIKQVPEIIKEAYYG